MDDNPNLSDCYCSCFFPVLHSLKHKKIHYQLLFLHRIYGCSVQSHPLPPGAYNPLLHTMAPQIRLHEHRIQNLWDCPDHVRNHIQTPLQSHPDSDMGHILSANRIICHVPLYRKLPVSDNLASLIQVHSPSTPSCHPHLLPAAGRFHSFSECQSWHARSYLPESQVWTHNMAQAERFLLSLIPDAQPGTLPAGNRRPLCVSDGLALWSA